MIMISARSDTSRLTKAPPRLNETNTSDLSRIIAQGQTYLPHIHGTRRTYTALDIPQLPVNNFEAIDAPGPSHGCFTGQRLTSVTSQPLLP